MGEFFFLNSLVKHGTKIAVLIMLAIIAIGIGIVFYLQWPVIALAAFAAAAIALGYFIMVIVDLVKVIKDMLMPQ